MTHLRIEQNNGITEQVSPSVIEKLYEIVHSGNLDSSSNLMGSLNTTGTYQNYVDYLEEQFIKNGVRQLIITANKLYISFADPVVASYWANSNYGDGTGIDITSAASVLNIPNEAFKNNTSIQTFNELGRYFPNCTAINYYAFQGTSNLRSIDLSNITTVGQRAFDSSGLSGVLNLSKVNVLEEGCLALTNNVTEINIGTDLNDNNRITVINNNVFNHSGQNDNLLQKVTGLNKVQEIRATAFYNCRQLQSIDTTSELTTIRNGAFSECKSLECIDISNVTLIENLAFAYCDSLVDLATNNPTQKNTGATTYTFNWSTVPTSVFAGDPLNNKSFSFPNATSIKQSAFNSTKIVAISAPNVTSLEEQVFREANQLVSVNLPNVITIGNNCFQQCTSLSTLSIPLCTIIGSESFYGCSSLVTVGLTQLPSVVADGVFSGCSSLTDTFDLSNVTSVGEYGFSNCSATLSGSVSNIVTLGERAFWKADLSSIQTLDFQSIQSMKSGVFMDSKVNEIVLHNLTNSMSASFNGSTITSLSMPDCTTVRDSTAYNCPNLQSINLPMCQTIGKEAFRNNKVSNINLPSIVTLGQAAFYNNGSSLITVDLGENITSIGWEALGNYSSTNKITSLTVRAVVPPTFGYNNNKTYFSNCTIYVPATSVNDYKTASGWSYFASKIQAIPTT